MSELLFLKLGGSLITDKTRPYQPQLDRLAGLAAELAAFLKERPSLQLIFGHGSGSFGHTAGAEYGTRAGVHDARGWLGFAEVHYQAAQLNAYVMEALRAAGLPSLSFPPVASVIASAGRVSEWDLSPMRQALERGLMPVVFGDTVFDEARGGTILSTEDLFAHLAHALRPGRILLAGLEPGVWADYPARTRLLNVIHAGSTEALHTGMGEAEGMDVTGGMRSKVEQMLELVRSVEGLEVTIFSGLDSGGLGRALRGESIGTRLIL